MATILCVEDELGLREMISDELREAGHDVIQAEDGAIALRLAVHHGPDLIVSDITMPNMDGFEMLREIRANHPSLADVPVIFLSALADRTYVLDGVNRGADDYLTKPVDFELLLAKVAAKLRMSDRMISKKQREHVKLYKALSDAAVGQEAALYDVVRRRIVLVGRGNPELREVQRLLDQLGHDTHTFTSGSAYLRWVDEGKVSAEVTFLWFHTDDMQAPMIRKLASHKSGAYVFVVPETLGGAGIQHEYAGFSETLMLPTNAATLASLVETACQTPQKQASPHPESLQLAPDRETSADIEEAKAEDSKGKSSIHEEK